MNKTIQFIVKGRVQGVYFRASTQKKAETLHLTGWVRNLSDGAVEVLAVGDEKGVRELAEWLNHGPEHAQVMGVESKELPEQVFSSFTVRY